MASKDWDEAPEPRITSDLFERTGRERQIGREVVFLRPQQVVDREPDIGDRPVVRTSPPDFAVQLKPGGPNDCPSDANLRSDADAFRRFISGILPNVEVRARCAEGVETIAVWLGSAPTHREVEARERSLQLVSLLRGAETAAILITLRAIRAFAQAEFAKIPHRLAEDGSPSADGPIHLESIGVELQSTDKIITRVEGFDDRPWPDVDFTAIITDTISSVDGPVPCEASSTKILKKLVCDSSQDMDVDDADAALAAALGLLTVPFGIGFYFLSELLGAGGPEGDAGSGADAGAVGCSLIKLVQTPVPRPGRVGTVGPSLRISFARRSISSNGVVFAGDLQPCERVPRVTIEGPSSFTTSIERRVSGIYRAELAETVGDLRFQWSATHATIRNPTARSTQITFDLSGPVRNRVTESQITLAVTDGDGALAPVTKTVRIRLTSIPPQPPQRPGDDRPDRQPL